MLPYLKNRITSDRNVSPIPNVVTVSTNKIILNNVIEEDLQSVLKPLNLMQNLFLCAKYSIRDNIITANSSLYNCLRVLCVLTYQCCCIYNMIRLLNQCDSWDYSWLYCSTTVSDCFIYMLGDVMSTCTNINHTHLNVLLVKKLQHVLRFLKISSIELRGFVAYSWISVIILNLFCIILIVIIRLIFTTVVVIELINIYASLIFNVNVIYAVLVLKLLEKMLKVWIENIKNSTDSEIEADWNTLLDVYYTIQETFILVEKTFGQYVSLFSIS